MHRNVFTIRLLAESFLLVFVLSPSLAGEPLSIPTEGLKSFRVIKDIIYLEPTRTEKMDLYIPKGLPVGSRCPAIVWVHGNGGAKDETFTREECETFADAGYICASVDWTLDTPFRVLPALDCKNAVRFLRRYAEEYHVDPEHIAIGGGSAGGYLALMVAFAAGEKEFEPTTLYPSVKSDVNAVIDFYGVYDGFKLPLIQRQMQLLPADLAGVADTIKSVGWFQPVNHLTARAPPVLIVQGRDDSLCDYHQSVELSEDLTSKGIQNELILLDHVGHTFNFTTWKNQPLPRDLRPVVLDFLSKHLGPGYVEKRIE